MAGDTPESVPSFMGVPMKHISLVTVRVLSSEKPIVPPHNTQSADNGLVDVPKLSADSRKSLPRVWPYLYRSSRSRDFR